jgi:hypothetical protein
VRLVGIALTLGRGCGQADRWARVREVRVWVADDRQKMCMRLRCRSREEWAQEGAWRTAVHAVGAAGARERVRVAVAVAGDGGDGGGGFLVAALGGGVVVVAFVARVVARVVVVAVAVFVEALAVGGGMLGARE